MRASVLGLIAGMEVSGHPLVTGDGFKCIVNAFIVVRKARILLVMFGPGSGHFIVLVSR